jgi:hypothetical protein
MAAVSAPIVPFTSGGGDRDRDEQDPDEAHVANRGRAVRRRRVSGPLQMTLASYLAKIRVDGPEAGHGEELGDLLDY